MLITKISCCKLLIKTRHQLYSHQLYECLSWGLQETIRSTVHIYLTIIMWLIFHGLALYHF